VHVLQAPAALSYGLCDRTLQSTMMLEGARRERFRVPMSRIILACVLILAAVLRFWALGHGIPYALGVDEPEVLERAVNMMRSGSLHPHFFDYPALFIYIQAATATMRFMAGAVQGLWASLDQARPEDFYVWARAVTATFGVATVWVVYHAGLRWGEGQALLAAALLAVLPLHVRQSHYVLTDVPLTFFVALAMLLSMRASERGTLPAFAWAGAAVGLSGATKYTGVLALVLPLVACITTVKPSQSRLVLAVTAIASCGAAFVLGAPYSLLDLPAFLDGFARLSSEYRTLPALAEPGWSLYLKHLRLVLGWPASLLLAAGLALGLAHLLRRQATMQWAMVTLFPLLYFAFVSDQRLVFARYLLPITPAICILVSAVVFASDGLLLRYGFAPRARTAGVAVLAIVALTPPMIQAIQFDRTIARRSTFELAYRWIQENVPRGARVAVETRGLLLAPGDFAAQNFPRLIVDHETRGPRDYDAYVQEGYDYLVASSQAYGPVFDAPHQAAREYAAYRRLFDQSTELIRFSPSAAHPGPELRIFKLRRDPSPSPAPR
jgi:hypothetical protein